jgi:predicted DNA-binding transcriptional regulator YafY
MSKISNTLSMIFYLNEQTQYVKIKDIADHLEIGEREVRRYRDDLEMAGFSIENKSGRDGGYKLLHKIKFALGLTQTETLLLNLSVRNNKNVFQALNSTLSMVSKIKQDMIVGDNDISDETLYNLFQIQNAIESKRLLLIAYQSPRYGTGTYSIAPYFVRLQRNHYYLFAMHQDKLKSYDVDRILKMEETDVSYEIDNQLYDKEKNEPAFGIYRGDTKHTVVIEVIGRLNQYIESYFNDKIKVVEEKAKSTTYSFETYNLHESLYTILSMASFVKVILPQELKQMYLEELDKMKQRNR